MDAGGHPLRTTPGLPWRALALGGLLALHLLSGAVRAEIDVPREDRIKAVLVVKILKFVTWPAALLPPRDALTLCTLGDAPVAMALSAADGRSIGERQILVRHLQTPAGPEARSCHVLYIPASFRDWPALVGAQRTRPILTIGDAPEFARKGGMIGLLRGENRIGFEISTRTAREASLEIAAPLLELATVVD